MVGPLMSRGHSCDCATTGSTDAARLKKASDRLSRSTPQNVWAINFRLQTQGDYGAEAPRDLVYGYRRLGSVTFKWKHGLTLALFFAVRLFGKRAPTFPDAL